MGAELASPPPDVHGKRRVFVFAGGESEPPAGGLMSIHPATGKVDFVFPWRSRSRESVNASCPVVFDNKVFISASYRTGSALIEALPDFTQGWCGRLRPSSALQQRRFIATDTLYGFDGRNEPDASLACVDAARREDCLAGDTRVDGAVRVARREASGSRGHVRRIAAWRLMASPSAWGELGHLLWMDHTEGLQRSVAVVAVSGA